MASKDSIIEELKNLLPNKPRKIGPQPKQIAELTASQAAIGQRDEWPTRRKMLVVNPASTE